MTRRQRLEYYRRYRNLNRLKIREYSRLYASKTYPRYRPAQLKYARGHKQVYRDAVRRYLENHPWMRHGNSARRRCRDSKHIAFKRYGGRGIKYMLTQLQLKKLWFRDQAWKLVDPSIDRISNDGNYEVGNCHFIERSDNSRKGVVC